MRFPHRFSAAMAAFALAVAAVPSVALAAIDAFLEIDGIKGESQDDKHKDWIEVLSVSQIQTAPRPNIGSQASGAGAGKVKFNEFTIRKTIDKASPSLFKYCATGKHIPTAVLTMRKAGGDPHEYLTYTLRDAIISSITPVAGSNPPQEQLVITYASMTIAQPSPVVVAHPPTAISH